MPKEIKKIAITAAKRRGDDAHIATPSCNRKSGSAMPTDINSAPTMPKKNQAIAVQKYPPVIAAVYSNDKKIVCKIALHTIKAAYLRADVTLQRKPKSAGPVLRK